MLAAETVSVPLPEFFKVTVCVPVELTVTLPNATGDGEMVSCGAVVVTPVAFIATVAGDPAALLVIERLPLIAPADVGTQTATNELLWPPAKFTGRVRPVVVNPAVALTAEMVSVPAPEF